MKEKIDNSIGWLERLIVIVDKYKITTIFKTLFILLFLAVLSTSIYYVVNPSIIIEKWQKIEEEGHIKQIKNRLENNEKIHILCEKILQQTNADRVMLLELHNSGNNLSGLPFVKASAIYESLNTGIKPINHEYQNVQLSLLPFTSVLFKERYLFGDVDSLINIDKHLYYKLLSNDACHYSACVIRGVNSDLGILFITYQNKPQHNCIEIKEFIKDKTLELSLLLELNKEKKSQSKFIL